MPIRVCAIVVAVVFVVACGVAADDPPPGTQLTLVSPVDGAEVEPSELVKGTIVVKGAAAETRVPVYVLVHPLLTNMWWVQRLPPPPNRDGSWQTLVYYGTEHEGAGERFEVVAIAGGPRLEEGQTLERLPANVVRSDIVTVRRRQ